MVGVTLYNDKANMIDAEILTAWRERVGVSRTTIWRWRKEGWFKLLRLHGRLYIPRETALEFERRMVPAAIPADRK